MDKIIKKIMEKIENNGYEAYIVGGYVRDALRGINSFDVDICTNALPKEIHKLFNINSNIYGSSNIKIGKYNIDITTYRKELSYENRKPNSLIYINSLDEDLKRRDFTINTICMDKNEHIIDKLEGIIDLNKGIIKSVGNPIDKIKEDPLRILRAIRLATTLDFELDEELNKAIKDNYMLVKTLSKERIKNEYSKILMSKNFQKGLNLSKKYKLNELLNITYDKIIYTPSILGMWAQINFSNMPFTKQEKSTIIKIAEILKIGSLNNLTLYKYGLYPSTVAFQILGISPKEINKLYKKIPIKERKDIAITYTDIINILDLKSKNNIKNIYQDLEENILNYNLKNNNKEIKKYLEKNKGKW